MLRAKQLIKQGWEKNIKAIDARLAQRAGLYIRTLSSANVEKHLADCGLSAEFGTHYRMSALSGGQKVKVVMAACMWNQPHILILDEPTNYLDRESLGALAGAIENFEGGVVIISHNNEFVSQVRLYALYYSSPSLTICTILTHYTHSLYTLTIHSCARRSGSWMPVA